MPSILFVYFSYQYNQILIYNFYLEALFPSFCRYIGISPFLPNLRTLINFIQSLLFVLKTPFGTSLLLQALLMPLNKLLHYMKNLLKTKLPLLFKTLDLIPLKNNFKKNSSLICINSFWNTGLACFFLSLLGLQLIICVVHN